ncbi:valine--tRNA ligase [Candidatus Woesearchaeota archaeon]|nr:valine--tRNA ligase [Candidatus Woesearchaeota archaeon]MCF7901278.1 valine--tRNA ligase [Candidatus Woesearchaeota archaeon]MCF8013555.1 valine--tRNA ligase [Candidatus Woesearchaeota archaeon]
MELPKRYEPKESEKKWADFWDKEDIFTFKEEELNENKEIYSIDTPPPTVSGKMHIGHASSYSQGDMIVRYHRMTGKTIFYPFGTDDNGLPTEKLVEKTKKVKSTRMERSEFVELCENTIKEIKPEFTSDWIKLGISANYKNSYSTIDKHSMKTSQKSFIELFKKGRIYEQESPMSWCPKCQTAIAQAEFENVDMTSHFSDIAFKHKDQDLIIATTRPEMIPACVALFAHPEDERYKNLKGKFATVPLFNYEVPILFDEAVAMDKGTGLMMVCTFGDKEDVEKWHKYKLPLKTVFTKDGKLNSEAGKYEGLQIKEARKEILNDLKNENLLLKQKDIVHAVNVHERCGTEVEILKTKQWFIKVLDKKQELIEAADKIKWRPEFMKKRYVHWVENLQWDWCISRQRHFGIPFPVWRSKKTGEIILAEETQLPVDPIKNEPKTLPSDHNSSDIIPETDVMDTWATSSLTPQIALNWAENSENFKKIYPETIRLQAHDIIRTWAFYTITKGIFHHNEIPWKQIMISGFVLDPKGNKMSKSKGNTISPQEVRENYSSDAIRYWAAGTKLGEDIPYQEKDVQTGKKTINKIFNASKFAIMNLENHTPKEINKTELEIMDKWLLSKLQKTIKLATQGFEEYEYSRAKHETDKFFWQKFCDNYLEFIKHRTYGEDQEQTAEHRTQNPSKLAAQTTLYNALLTQIKLFAPIMPFITEEIYQMYFKEYEKTTSIHITNWPKYNSELIDEESEIIGDLAVEINSEVRKYKSENKLSLKEELEKITIECTKEQQEQIQKIEKDLKKVGNIQKIEYKEEKELKINF